MNAPTQINARKVLLIVEDQLILAMGLKDELEDGGYRVLELAMRNSEAMSLALAVRPDLALVNIELADGDDGVVLAGDLLALGVPVLFISGQPERARSAKAVGIGSIAKPYSPSDMVEAVDYLFRHASGDESRPGPSCLEVFDAPNVSPGQRSQASGDLKRIVSRLFDKKDQAEAAVRELESMGISHDDLSIVAPYALAREARSFRNSDADRGGMSDVVEAADTALRASEGLAAGGLIGGGVGALIGLGVLTIPGLGPVIVGGWLVSMAIGAAAGGVAGGAMGGLLGALKDNGVPEGDANVYAEGVRRGATLVSVRVEEADAARVEASLDLNNGADATIRGETYRQEGWTAFNANAPFARWGPSELGAHEN
jgi:DNA-binding response OmpR family regulator